MNRPDKRFQVEPLSEAKWARIERSLWERLDASAKLVRPDRHPGLSLAARWSATSAWRFAAALIVAGGLAASLGVLASSMASRPESDLVAPSHLETGASASQITIGGATLDISPRSELDVSGDEARGIIVLLERGRVECDVSPRIGKAPFVVQAGHVSVRVVGTRFSVIRAGGDVSVAVTRGTVEVRANGDVHAVHAGQHWSEPEAEIAASSAVSDSKDSAAAVALGHASAGAEVSEGAARGARASTRPSPTPASTGPGSSQTIEASPPPDGVAAGPRADGSLGPTASPSTTSEATHRAHPTGAAAGARTDANREPTASPLTARKDDTVDEEASRRMAYEAAERLEPTDPAAALAGYRRLMAGSDGWSANALYAAARLEADRGDHGAARGLLRAYLAKYPHGPNASDARDLLERLGRPSSFP
jgi:hypothetical protein